MLFCVVQFVDGEDTCGIIKAILLNKKNVNGAERYANYAVQAANLDSIRGIRFSLSTFQVWLSVFIFYNSLFSDR